MNIKNKFNITCPCGKVFLVQPCHFTGRKKYCSKKCFYKYRKRSKGLSYVIVAKNKGWFNNGELYLDQLHKKDHNKYIRLHNFIYKNKDKIGVCIKCGKTKKTNFCNISREYKKDLDDWVELCCSCHKYYDFHRLDKTWLV